VEHIARIYEWRPFGRFVREGGGWDVEQCRDGQIVWMSKGLHTRPVPHSEEQTRSS
jgi:hypothetical protein